MVPAVLIPHVPKRLAMSKTTRTIRVEALSRVEGEGALHIQLEGEQIRSVQLNIYEPPRFFEAFLRGRPLEEVPDVTARICGICPVAYMMSSIHALEQALGLVPSSEVRMLRRLLYCGEWIESHALHMHLLHAPDFLGYDGGIEMARDHPDAVNRGLRLKKHGNQLLEMIGGRAIHPINVAVGGFYRIPRREEFERLIPDFEWGLQASIDATRWVSTFQFREFERPCELVALSHPDEYAMNEGVIASTMHPPTAVADFETVFPERHVAHSTALQATRADGSPYFLGPLARVTLNHDRLMPQARRLCDEVGLTNGTRNPYRSIVARGVELTHAYEEALQILRAFRPNGPARQTYEYRAGEGRAATEAPRGLLYHRYKVDDDGRVQFATIVPPTSQNQFQMESDLRILLPELILQADAEIAQQCERLVRSYDPCISCSTHFLKVRIDREPAGSASS